MNANRLRYALGPVVFLDSIADQPRGFVELGAGQLLVWHPEAIGQIFRAERGMSLASSDTLRPLVGDRSLLFANGPRHRTYRTVLGEQLRGNQLAAYRGTIAEATERAVRDMLSAGTVCLPDWTRMLTLRIIARIVLGDTPDALLRMFTTWVEGALGSRRRTLLYRHVRASAPWRTFVSRRADVDQCLLAVVRRNRAEHRGTMVDLLLDPDGPLGELDDGELRDQVVSLLFAGHETTASAIAATLYWLERHPDVRDGIRDELAASGDDGSSAARVPLLDAACRESLRLSPPAMVAGHRVPGEDMLLLGRRVAAGTKLTPCIYLAHRRSGPGGFTPERFIGARHSGHEYLPFGGGGRRCLGADLAMLELRMVVAAVVRRVDLTCVNPRAGRPSVRGPAMGVGRDLRMLARPCRR